MNSADVKFGTANVKILCNYNKTYDGSFLNIYNKQLAEWVRIFDAL